MSNSISGSSPLSGSTPPQTSPSLDKTEQDILKQIEEDPTKAAQLLSKLSPQAQKAVLKKLIEDNPEAGKQVLQTLSAQQQPKDSPLAERGDKFNVKA